MKKYLGIVIIIVLFFEIYSQEQQFYHCDPLPFQGRYALVNAENGLNLRIGPNQNSEIITTLNFGDRIYTCDTCFECDSQIINGVKGDWKKIVINDLQGFVFDSYLDYEEIEFFFPNDYIGDQNKNIFDTSSTYYGVTQFLNQLKIEEYKSKDETFGETATIGTIKIIKNRKDSPKLILKGLNIDNLEFIDGKFYDKMIFPGDGINCHFDQEYTLYAKAEIEYNNNHFNPLQKISEYKLILRKRNNDGGFQEQLIYKGDWIPWKNGIIDGGVFMKFIGDLDNDGQLDMIITIAENGCVWENLLLLSTKKEIGKLLGVVARYSSAGC